MSSEPKNLVTVQTALRILLMYSEDETEIGVTELSKRLAVSKSTIHRLAVTLVNHDMLKQNPVNRKYRLGGALLKLGDLVRAQ